MMLKFGFRILICLGIISVITACSTSLRPFTQRMHETYAWDEGDLKKVQFFLSSDIVLHRELAEGESVIKEGRITIREGRRVEEVIIPEGTPGILVFMPKTDRLAITFEDGTDKYLIFGPNPKRSGRYVLLASEWEQREGEVSYNGKKYRTPASSAYAELLVDFDKINQVTVQRRKAKGRTI